MTRYEKRLQVLAQHAGLCPVHMSRPVCLDYDKDFCLALIRVLHPAWNAHLDRRVGSGDWILNRREPILDHLANRDRSPLAGDLKIHRDDRG
jgi:hypothetical protein